MEQNIVVSQEEILALLYLPFFRTPNLLSPFYPLQVSQEEVEPAYPEEGFERLEEQELWDPYDEELTYEARQLFVPVFAPKARVMLFRGAYATTPFQEFYIYNKYVVQFFDKEESEFRGISEKILAEHLRKTFSEKRPPYTDNQLSLFEPEYMALFIITLLKHEGERPDLNGVLQYFNWALQNDGLHLPILGTLTSHDIATNSSLRDDVIARSVDSLLSEGLISHTPEATLELEPLIGDLFEKIYKSKGLYMIREEFEGDQILAREASVFPGERGYFVGRCSFHQQFQTRIVHIEDLEWHELYRLVNEIARDKDYLPKLTLEVTRRFHAHLRG